MRKLLSLCTAGVFALTVTTVMFASSPAHAGEGEDVYGTAGCGLGSIIFGDKEGFIQVIAATFNGTAGNQTFAISSGTSNCEEQSKGTDSAKVYIEGNKEALAKEIAQGQGEAIAGLSEVAGCSDASAVGSSLQANYATIFPSADASGEQVGNAIIQTLKREQMQCALL